MAQTVTMEDQEYQMVFNNEEKDFYNTCEKHLNSSKTFSISITDKKTQTLITKYNEFFISNIETKSHPKLSIVFVLFDKHKIVDFYNLYIIALLYEYHILFIKESGLITVRFTATQSFNRTLFFNSLGRETFPTIDYPSKKFYNVAKTYCNDHKYLVIKLINTKKINAILLKALNSKNAITSTQIYYPIYLKMLLDYVQLILNWNIIFYVENKKLYILCTAIPSNELIQKRN